MKRQEQLAQSAQTDLQTTTNIDDDIIPVRLEAESDGQNTPVRPAR